MHSNSRLLPRYTTWSLWAIEPVEREFRLHISLFSILLSSLPSPRHRHAGPSPFHLLLLLFVAVQPHQKLIAVLLHVPSFSSSIQIFLSKIELDYWFEIATDLDVQLSGYIYNFWLFFFLILNSSFLLAREIESSNDYQREWKESTITVIGRGMENFK